MSVHEGIKRRNSNKNEVQRWESVEEKAVMISTRTSSTEDKGNSTLNTSIDEYDKELSGEDTKWLAVYRVQP